MCNNQETFELLLKGDSYNSLNQTKQKTFASNETVWAIVSCSSQGRWKNPSHLKFTVRSQNRLQKHYHQQKKALFSLHAFSTAGHNFSLLSLSAEDKSSLIFRWLFFRKSASLAACQTASLKNRDVNWKIIPLGVLFPGLLWPSQCGTSTTSGSLSLYCGKRHWQTLMTSH